MEDAALAGISADVDGTDPLVVALTWGLTQVAAKFLSTEDRARFRSALPSIAVIIAVGSRAAIDTASGETLTTESLLRALAAAGVAVLAHSQGREVSKARSRRAAREG